ncbi:alkaline phosphatase [Colwellia piezophila]|uniref:alkaline phosphatase n=1 Tax=Colwellia piezophila TaxID=211668 RepID=UPI0003628B0E|nr:alkaline phosphatase [Colwellia piezophila]
MYLLFELFKFKFRFPFEVLLVTLLIACGNSEIPDTSPPLISLNGESSITLFFNGVYKELGANAIDERDGIVEVVLEGNIDTSTVGNYIITYSAIDKAGNQESLTRIVEVVLPVNAKNVILFIGDGMGAEHRKAARWLSKGVDGKLSMDDMPIRGTLKTYSADNAITDSAAAATAMATGIKTNNGVISLDENLNHISTILEEAKNHKKVVGVVTTTHVTHATPAAFTSHVKSRKLMLDIAQQIIDDNIIDVLLGGGEDEFKPTNDEGCFPGAGERIDGRDLIYEAVSIGYKFVCDSTSFDVIDTSSSERILGLFAGEGMIRPYSPTLATMTSKAIEILSKNPEGFVLMIEGGQIDWASHSHDAENAITDTIALDDAVDIAKEFALVKRDTLIIVTADHETGGMWVSKDPSGLENEDGPYNIKGGGSFYINWSTTGHTSVNVPVTAMGPQSEKLIGVNENTVIYDIIFNTF